MRRSDDRVSRELLARWYDPKADATTLLVGATLGRLVNWTDALMEATDGGVFQLPMLDQVRVRLHARAARGEKVFTGAYVVPGVPGRSKVDSVCDLAGVVLADAERIVGQSLRQTWGALEAVRCWATVSPSTRGTTTSNRTVAGFLGLRMRASCTGGKAREVAGELLPNVGPATSLHLLQRLDGAGVVIEDVLQCEVAHQLAQLVEFGHGLVEVLNELRSKPRPVNTAPGAFVVQ